VKIVSVTPKEGRTVVRRIAWAFAGGVAPVALILGYFAVFGVKFPLSFGTDRLTLTLWPELTPAERHGVNGMRAGTVVHDGNWIGRKGWLDLGKVRVEVLRYPGIPTEAFFEARNRRFELRWNAR
jgi:hypothetical protein